MTNQFPDATKKVLSPAQVVRDAFSERYEFCGPFDDNWLEVCLAAAFRAAADQVVPEQKLWHRTGIPGSTRHDVRAEFLAIAAELEGQPQ